MNDQYQQNKLIKSLLLTEHKKGGGDHNIWRWKSRYWLGTGIQMWSKHVLHMCLCLRVLFQFLKFKYLDKK